MNRVEVKAKVEIKSRNTLWYYVAYAFCWFLGNKSLTITKINGKVAKKLTMNDLFK